jgi:hypothetical protein
MDNELNGINVMSDGDKSGFLVLDEGGNMIKTELNHIGLLGPLLSITLSFLSCLLLKSFRLLLFSFRSVFGKEFEKLVS